MPAGRVPQCSSSVYVALPSPNVTAARAWVPRASPAVVAAAVCRNVRRVNRYWSDMGEDSYDFGTNFTHTGDPTSAFWPVGFSSPVAGSMANTRMLSPSWLATTIHLPDGSMLKFRGVLMPSPWWPTALMCPVASSMAKMAMLLCPRFEVYTNFPFGWTTVSAVEFPFVGAGRGESVLRIFNSPFAAS